MRTEADVESRRILDVRVDATSYADARSMVMRWARGGEQRYVCACNVHMVMEAHDDPGFAAVVNEADLVTADGMPLVWALRAMGVREARRVYGPDLMLELCAAAELEDVPVGLFGGSPAVLEHVVSSISARFPGLSLVYAHSPPFGDAADHESELVKMRSADVRLLFVALGCPRQERWMASHRGQISAVMVGVGAAFDFLGGSKPQAPPLLQSMGLEWLFRLVTEPRRLWRRYAVHNPRFVYLLARQLAARSRTS